MTKMSKAKMKWRAKQPFWVRRAIAQQEFFAHKMSTWHGRLHLGMLLLLAVIITKRVKVANRLHAMTDSQLVTAGLRFVDFINAASALFVTPSPALSLVSSAISDFQTAITAAGNRDKEKIAAKNAKRETLMNLLAVLGNYVEDIANDPANVDQGPVDIIELAGMRARVFMGRGKQMWEVVRGFFSGSLFLTAETVHRGTHDWQYTTTPTNEDSWISAVSTTKAKTTITGLTPGSFVYCRHRTVTKIGQSDWEGHDPVIVG